MRFDILSLFPDYFTSPFETSIIKKAREGGLLDIRLTDVRQFAEGKHKKVDDRPYGGGPGMVMMPKPLCQAIRSVKHDDSHVIYLSPQGKPLTAETCQRLSQLKHIVLVCGHYEGIDERVIEKEVDEEVSIGDYVLTNGCIAAIVLVDAVSRFVPGVLGHEEAAMQDSFQDQKLDAPHYTRPPEFEGLTVPSVLMEGNHKEIQKWRHQKAIEKTKRIRPDLCGGSYE
ncbi:MAG: tRNA (guanosine(37)-N1)-methyltransferase TrmD [Chlamydiae bacterium]|nr:tRNA (guanosine(37)-N1)-methyltransferase TrmD [Chlamydiota bacterium]